jgi:cytochrome c biogenesis protein CcdA
MNKILQIPLLLLIAFNASAQETNSGDLMRSNGKINVVAGVFLIIMLGYILYLIRTDRKIKKLEDHHED